jgi:hypothetical protein
MVTYEALVAACLRQGVMPAVVPQLKTITLGGALAGVGIESSSHRQGLVHDTVLELDVLLGDGRVVTCTPGRTSTRISSSAFPNSYARLGYALRGEGKTLPVKPYVHLSTSTTSTGASTSRSSSGASTRATPTSSTARVSRPTRCSSPSGHFVDKAPVRQRLHLRAHLLPARSRSGTTTTSPVHDYLWRWDNDWFWCSKNVLAQNRSCARFLYGRKAARARASTP